MRFVAFTVAMLATAACNSPPPPSPGAQPTTVATQTTAPPIASSAPTSAGATITVVGIARDVKGGAAIVADDGTLTRVEGLDAWPKALVDRRVIAEGVMKKQPGAACVNDPLPCQGIGEDHWVLANAKFRLE